VQDLDSRPFLEAYCKLNIAPPLTIYP